MNHSANPISAEVLDKIDGHKQVISTQTQGYQQSLKELYDLAMSSSLRGYVMGVLDDLIAAEEKTQESGKPVSLLFANLAMTRANIIETKGMRSEVAPTLSLLQRAWDHGVSGRTLEVIRSPIGESINVLRKLQPA